jgi:2-oxoglutarate dehydrogenase E2 component (dihydrolipoamide succinyltransferase)
MAIDITIPEVGESITEGILSEWLKKDGDWVEIDDEILVLETDKITMNITADASGKLSIKVADGETVEVGQVVGALDPDAEAPDTSATEAASQQTPQDTSSGPGSDAEPAEKPAAKASPESLDELSSAVRKLVVEHGLDPDGIDATGKGGRLTKEDVLRHLANGDGGTNSSPAAETPRRASGAPSRPLAQPSPEPVKKKRPEPPREAPRAVADRRQSRDTMSRLRSRLAERLTQVQQTAAILTTFNEVDMSRVMALRSDYKEAFKQRHDVGLGFMSFFVKATVDALKTVPRVNAFIEGDEIVTNHYYDIGVAVSTEHGLVVPVIRGADRLSMAEIEQDIMRLAGKAKDRTLELSDLTGAVFTISNGGVFGSMMSTPILNPPGSAILGMHAITKRAVVVDDEIVIRPMMYLAVSYDHRLIDGSEAVTFLKRIKDCIENPERMLLEV